MRVAPTKILLLGFSRNYASYLLKDSKWTIQVNQDVVKAEMAFLYDHIVITSFVGKLDPLLWHLYYWLANLSQKVGGSKMLFDCNLGRESFMFKTKGLDTMRKLLMFTTFKMSWGMCIFQGWILGFNSNNPQGMIIPTWITFRKLSVEFQNVGSKIAIRIGTLLGCDKATTHTIELRFCMALEIGEG